MKDASIILKMLKSESVMTGNDELHYEIKHIQEHIKGKSFVTFVCEFDKKFAGFISLNLFSIGKYAEIYNIMVDKKYRKKSIALELIKFGERYLKNKGYGIIYMYVEESNRQMQDFSRKINYDKGKKFIFYSKILK